MTGSHEVRGSIPLGSTNRIIANSKMRQVFSEGKISRFAGRNLRAVARVLTRVSYTFKFGGPDLRFCELSGLTFESRCFIIQGDDHA
jgi:hypothetical protein